MDPRDVPRLLSPGSMARASALLVSVAIARAGSRSLLAPPGSAYLRASPVSHRVQMALAAALVLAIQLPWGIVYAAGRAPLEGLGLMCALAAACVGATPWLVVSLGVAWACAPLGVLVFARVLPRAFTDAGVFHRGGARVRLRGPASLLLLLAHLRTLRRGFGARLALAAMWPLLGLQLVRVADDRTARAASLAATVAALGAAPLLSPITRTHQALVPVIAGRPRWLPLLLAIAVVATPSMAFAAGAGQLAQPDLHPWLSGSGLVAVLVVLHGHLSRVRKDAVWWSMLLALPLVALFTVAATSLLLPSLGLVLAFVLPAPEVLRAHDR